MAACNFDWPSCPGSFKLQSTPSRHDSPRKFSKPTGPSVKDGPSEAVPISSTKSFSHTCRPRDVVQSNTPYHRRSVQIRESHLRQFGSCSPRPQAPAVGSIPRSLLHFDPGSRPSLGQLSRQSRSGYDIPVIFRVQEQPPLDKIILELVQVRGDVTGRRMLPQTRGVASLATFTPFQ